jgi:hypothetical protein
VTPAPVYAPAMLTICAWCPGRITTVKNSDGTWVEIRVPRQFYCNDAAMRGVEISHGICPDCFKVEEAKENSEWTT